MYFAVERSSAAEIPSLTPLRGIAALIVLLYHADVYFLDGATAPGIGIARGYLAVDFFFVLSGFVLTHVYAGGFSRRGRDALWPFLWARVARIFPVHLATLALLLPLYGLDREHSAAALIANILLVQAPWSLEPSWNQSSWSISAEWHAYLLFPLLAGWLVSCSSRTVVRMAAFAAMALVSVLWLTGNANIDKSPVVLARALPEFFIGMATYRAFASDGLRWIAADGVAIGLAAAIIVISESSINDAMIVLLLPALLLSCARNTGSVARVLRSAPCVFLGYISYSLYLGQTIVLPVEFAIIPGTNLHGEHPIVLASAFVSLSLAFSTALSFCIEHPARDLIRRAIGYRALRSR